MKELYKSKMAGDKIIDRAGYSDTDKTHGTTMDGWTVVRKGATEKGDRQ